jgi:hypothetical protein
MLVPQLSIPKQRETKTFLVVEMFCLNKCLVKSYTLLLRISEQN